MQHGLVEPALGLLHLHLSQLDLDLGVSFCACAFFMPSSRLLDVGLGLIDIERQHGRRPCRQVGARIFNLLRAALICALSAPLAALS